MKRKIIAIILVILFLVPFTQAANADSSGLCFTATNDLLLDLGSMTAFVSGIAYVPAKVFSTFGVYNNYFPSDSTATLYNSRKNIFFNLSSGNSYDSQENTYSVSAVMKNGQVYVPVAWVCQYFGLYYSYISGDGYGDIVRIKNGAEVLTDAKFFNAAASLMQSYYNESNGTSSPSTPTPSQPIPSDDENSGASVSLSFIGLPSEKLLDSLDDYATNACFFVTADDVASSPDTIRRICGSGHSIGIYCVKDPAEECPNTEDLIFEAAQVRPVLICSAPSISESTEEYAKSNGYAYFDPALELAATVRYASDVTNKLESVVSYTSIMITITESTETYIPSVLSYAALHHITLLPLRETLV
ncbi:MAG: hypothetical protein VB064_10875 [Oscillospiraceae bacterium]|nr:hypothetical protein [Oscillospiraceae bacterium]